MAAYTTLPDGSIRRWHADITECALAECPERHLSKAELFADLDGTDAREHYRAQGVEHR